MPVAPQLQPVRTVPAPCPLCARQGPVRTLLRITHRSPYNPERSLPCPVSVVRCRGCGMLRLDPRPDDASLEALQGRALGDAESAVGSFEAGNTNHDYPGFLADKLRRLGFAAGGRLLDVGCGSGDLASAAAALVGGEAAGLEMNAGAVERARRRFPDGTWLVGTLEPGHFPSGRFQAVTLIHVLEHLTDPERDLRTMLDWLQPGGILLVEVPNGEFYFHPAYSLLFELPKSVLAPLIRSTGRVVPYTARGFYPYHLSLFGRKSLAALVEKAGFQVLGVEPATSRLSFWLRQNRAEGRRGRAAINRLKLAMARIGLADNLFLAARRPRSGT